MAELGRQVGRRKRADGRPAKGAGLDSGALRVRVDGAQGSIERPPIIIAGLSAPTGGGTPTLDGVPLAARLEACGHNRALLHGSRASTPVLFLPAPERSEEIRSVGAGGPATQRFEVLVHGWRLIVTVEPAARAALRDLAQRARSGPAPVPAEEVRAIIPGRVASVAVSQGAEVRAGQALLIVEAMKMQNEVRAPRGGTVRLVAVVAGQTVDAGALLVVIE